MKGMEGGGGRGAGDPMAGNKRRNQCCGFGMFIPDTDFYTSRISDPGSRIQKQVEKREG
jgi:hypothetical protein